MRCYNVTCDNIAEICEWFPLSGYFTYLCESCAELPSFPGIIVKVISFKGVMPPAKETHIKPPIGRKHYLGAVTIEKEQNYERTSNLQ